jgi:hypothetical protein
MENNQFTKDEELNDEKLFLENIILNGKKYANESMGKKHPPISIFYLRTRDMRSYGCPTKFSFIPLSLKLNIYIGCLVPMI